MSTQEQRVLTLVAQSNGGEYVLPDGNGFLKQVQAQQQLVSQRRAGALEVHGIRAVNEISRIVNAFSARGGPVLLQLVGHGRPGELELSFSWDRRYRDDLRFYLIDNNSRELGLLSPCRGQVEEVRLVACNVGADEGHPLLFTLSKMLDCAVSGALGAVSPAMFDAESGLYSGAMTVCAQGTQRFSVLRPPVLDVARAAVIGLRANLAVDPSTKITASALHWERGLAMMGHSPGPTPIAAKDGARLFRRVAPLAGLVHGSAVPELELAVLVASAEREPRQCVMQVMSDRTATIQGAAGGHDLPRVWRVELDEAALADVLADLRAPRQQVS